MAAEANILAAAKLRAKTPVGSPLNSAEWADVPIALRDRAFFSAELEKMRLLQRMQERVQGALDLLRRPGEGREGGEGAFQTREKFIAEMQKLARDEGLDPRNFPGRESRLGGIRDITSERRLKLIYDVQTESAQEYARWKAEQDPDVLAAYPAQEFVRIKAVKKARVDWPERWRKAGGKAIQGRMVALKNDPVWRKLSRFGTPYPPFDFGSGMGLRDISRADAEKLGLIKRGDPPPVGAEEDFNAELKASIADLNPEYRRLLPETFGDQIAIDGDSVAWRGNLITDLFDQATGDPQFQDRVSLGKMSPRAVEALAEVGVDMEGWEFDLAADDIRHAIKKHGEPGVDAKGRPIGEHRGDQQPLARQDFEALPWVLREPDIAGQGDEPGVIGLTKDLDGQLVTIFIERSQKNKKANLRSMWKKK
jgi:hypothetical protein